MAKNFYANPGREEFYKNRKRELDRERKRTLSRNRPFVAWDGEGFNDMNGIHTYMLMVNSENSALDGERSSGIRTDEAFRFLLDGAENNPDAIHIMYGMSYDVNMILHGLSRELPFRSLQRLVSTNRCVWMDYDIEYVPRRFFRIAHYAIENNKTDGRRIKGKLLRSVSIWDVMQFFQCSFVDALRGMFTEKEMPDYFDIEFIESQKKRRGVFTIEDLQSGLLMKYSMAEVNALVELMVRFRRNCHDSGIHLNRYDGAGAGASALMQDNGLRTIIKTATGIMDADVNVGLPQAVQIAYGGGHVEMFMFGHTDQPVYHYDMVGSFPSQMPDLPDLSDGRWTHHNIMKVDMSTIESQAHAPHADTDDFSIYKVYWDYRDNFTCMFPFFYRSPWESPRIYYPPQGYSWVWSPELRAAMSPDVMKYLKCYPKVVEMWKFTPYHSDSRPFEFVNQVYQRRLWYKHHGLNGQAIGIKSALNAIPGKMAQTVGYYDGDGGVGGGGCGKDRRAIPQYFNLAYAGWITSCVRAKVFAAMMQAPYDIISVATDGVWSRVPLDLPIGENLGQWKYEELDGFTSIQPGIYFTRKHVGGRNVHHYRGFSDDSIKEEHVIQAWSHREYGVRIPTQRFVTMVSIKTKEEYQNMWCTWQDTERILHIQQGLSTKRTPLKHHDEDEDEVWPTPRAAYELIETDAASIPRFEENVSHYSETGTDVWGVSLETYLSRSHHVPWMVSDMEEGSEPLTEHDVDWEIIESEI